MKFSKYFNLNCLHIIHIVGRLQLCVKKNPLTVLRGGNSWGHWNLDHKTVADNTFFISSEYNCLNDSLNKIYLPFIINQTILKLKSSAKLVSKCKIRIEFQVTVVLGSKHMNDKMQNQAKLSGRKSRSQNYRQIIQHFTHWWWIFLSFH